MNDLNDPRSDAEARLAAAADQLDAAVRDCRRGRLDEFLDPPPPEAEQLEPRALWQEGGVWCAVLDNPVGFLCGYARVPDGHPWVGRSCYEPVVGAQPLDTEQPYEQALDDHGAIPIFAAAIFGFERFEATLAAQVPVHGGLSWAGPMPIRGAPHGWWLGFDCGHVGMGDLPDPDRMPQALREAFEGLASDGGGHLWTVEEVQLEVKRMVTAIRQAA